MSNAKKLLSHSLIRSLMGLLMIVVGVVAISHVTGQFVWSLVGMLSLVTGTGLFLGTEEKDSEHNE